MNTMMDPWTIIPLSERKTYLAALEKASVEENIAPFAAFLAKLVRARSHQAWKVRKLTVTAPVRPPPAVRNC
jgi:hypothetical protein